MGEEDRDFMQWTAGAAHGVLPTRQEMADRKKQQAEYKAASNTPAVHQIQRLNDQLEGMKREQEHNRKMLISWVVGIAAAILVVVATVAGVNAHNANAGRDRANAIRNHNMCMVYHSKLERKDCEQVGFKNYDPTNEPGYPDD